MEKNHRQTLKNLLTALGLEASYIGGAVLAGYFSPLNLPVIGQNKLVSIFLLATVVQSYVMITLSRELEKRVRLWRQKL